nr:hypothetical protein [Donghicola eburneus]
MHTTQHTNTATPHSRNGGTPAEVTPPVHSAGEQFRGRMARVWEQHNAPQIEQDCWANSEQAKWLTAFVVAMAIAVVVKYVAGITIDNAAFNAAHFDPDWRG